MACVISVYSALLFALPRFVPCPNVYVSHRFVYDAQRQSIFSLCPLPLPDSPLSLSPFGTSYFEIIFLAILWKLSLVRPWVWLWLRLPGYPTPRLRLLLLPPHHFLLTKNSLLGNFSLFILFATLQKCLCPGQSMPQMHSIVPAPLWPRPLPVAVANRLPLTVRIPCVFIELRNVFYAL